MELACAFGLAETALLWKLARQSAASRGIELGAAPRGPLLAAALTGAALVAGGEIRTGCATMAIWVAAIVDARCGYVFDPLVGASLAAVSGVALFTGTLAPSLLGAGVAGASLLTLRLLSRNGGVGLGDVKLGALVGAALDVESGLQAIAASFVVGGVAAAGLLLAGKARIGTSIPFAPYVLAGTLMVVAYHRLNAGGH